MLSPTNQNDLFEVDVMFGIGEKPMFISVVINKVDFSVAIFLNEPEDDFEEIEIDDDVKILHVNFKTLDEAVHYYNEVRNPFVIDEIVQEYKSKEQ